MQLVIDSGNTRVKVAVFDRSATLVKNYVWEHPANAHYDALLKEYTFSAAIICSVSQFSEQVQHLLQAHIPYVLVLDHDTPLPICNGYATPQTLGYDRLAVAIGANALHPHTPLLVIDAGTAITYELVTSDDTYRGGNIAPGANMRFAALHQFTHKLPLLSLDHPLSLEGSLGVDTTSAIWQGIVQGMVYEMEGYIAHLKEKYPTILIFLTGGDAFFFERRLKSSIFVSPNLLLFGLHCILQYNQCLTDQSL